MNKNDKYMCSVYVRLNHLNYIYEKSISISFGADSFYIRSHISAFSHSHDVAPVYTCTYIKHRK